MGSDFAFTQTLSGSKWRARQYLPGQEEILASTPPASPESVRESWPARFQVVEEEPGHSGLRRPQYGAVHSLLGYWTTDPRLPATVVMPTGTGKTDTMVAALIAQRIDKLLVLVPSDALRDQLAVKFEELGVLPKLGLIGDDVMRPVVGRLFGALDGDTDADELAALCNVVVSTPNALSVSAPDTQRRFLSHFSHLFIDEAHHVAAPTWQAVRDQFFPRPVVQFTATPHRRDGQHLGGTLVYVFPLREAQREGYFSSIRYKSVLSLLEPDQEIAAAALEFLKSDLKAGHDHLVMARAKSVARAEELHSLYSRLAPEFAPVLIHSGVPKTSQTVLLKQLAERKSRILVCVDMFGEGFDLPQLKIAALHDPHRSLGITLQFVGRFARGGVQGLGAATVVAARSELRHDEPLRRLYAEDADWNHIIEDLSAGAIAEQAEIDEFTKAFNTLPDEVSIHSLTPALSTVVFRASAVTWHPDRIMDVVERSALVTYPVPVNRRDGVAWFVTRAVASPRWGDVDGVDAIEYDLYVIYWDAANGLLYINSSNNDSVHEKLAQAVLGELELQPLRGEAVYRVFHEVQRLAPNNVGLLDARSRNRRYTSYVGSDVTDALPVSQKQTKTQTHIAGVGYLDGARYSIAASLKGRVWSHRTADGLKPWVDWCDVVGPKIIDDSISVDEIMAGFIRPEDIDEWPDLHVLALEMPAELAELLEDADLEHRSLTVPFHEIELSVKSQPQGKELVFVLTCGAWTVEYRLVIERAGLAVRPVDPQRDVAVRRTRSSPPFSKLATRYGIRALLSADSVVEPPGVLLRPNRELEPFDRSRLQVVSWDGVDIRRESWGEDRDPHTVQGYMAALLLAEEWDLIIDDDGPGEVADLVALRAIDGSLLIRLVHCKYSHSATPGARLGDLYELAGQAQRSAAWRRNIDAMFSRLIRRERERAKQGKSGFVRGDIADLHRLFDEIPTLSPRLQISLAQPGMSATRVSQNQLELLASTDTYVSDTAQSAIQVFCSG